MAQQTVKSGTHCVISSQFWEKFVFVQMVLRSGFFQVWSSVIRCAVYRDSVYMISCSHTSELMSEMFETLSYNCKNAHFESRATSRFPDLRNDILDWARTKCCTGIKAPWQQQACLFDVSPCLTIREWVDFLLGIFNGTMCVCAWEIAHW